MGRSLSDTEGELELAGRMHINHVMPSLQVNGAGEIVRDDRSKMMKSDPLQSVVPPACPAHLLPEVKPIASGLFRVPPCRNMCVPSMPFCHGGCGKGNLGDHCTWSTILQE